MKKVYILTSENLTNLGGPMGTESTSINYQKPFLTMKRAKDFAVREYKNPLKWIKERDEVRTEDLGHVMYHIKQEAIA